MLVDLRSLKPNPLRDFTIDPIDDEKVAELKASIKEDGFWGGIVCRRTNGRIEIAAGHHRVQAAIAAGIKSAHLFVADDLDDAGMVRVYARENATQRGNSSSAIAGTIASAIRFITKAVLTNQNLSGIPERSERGLETIRGQLKSHDGLGEPVITAFLETVPGINKNTVMQQLANLKASGDYARLIGEVREQIEEEQREALKALAKAEAEHAKAQAKAQAAEAERKQAAAEAKAAREEADRKRTEYDRQRAEAEAKLAEKRRVETEKELKQFEALRQTRDTARAAAEKSAERKRTFDFEGVAEVLTKAHHVDAFREVVTSRGVQDLLPVGQQAALARKLVATAKTSNREFTGAFIREHIMSLLMTTRHAERRMSDADREAALRKDFTLRKRQYEDDFLRGLAIIATSGQKLHELLQQWPKGLPLTMHAEFRTRVERTQKLLSRLLQRL